MAGGNWEIQNKVRPGAYINFETNDLAMTGLESTGTVVIPMMLDWGESGKFLEVAPNARLKELFGKNLGGLVPLREAFKGTGAVTVYNLNGEGEKATATSGSFNISARYGGKDGNKINVTVTVGLNGVCTVKTFFEAIQVDAQMVKVATELVSNAYVTFEGSLPSSDISVVLTGGTTIPATNESYADFAAGLDTQDFKVVAVGTDDATIKAMIASKIIELRTEAGKNVVFVTNNYNSADHEGVNSVLNGVILEENEILTAKDAVYYFGAAYANAGTSSLTYTEYPGAVDCERLAHPEIVQALQDGHIVFTYNNSRVVIEQDINTFRSFTQEKNQDFRKNKIIREMDIVSDTVQYIYSTYFIGKMDNTTDGRDVFKGQVMTIALDPMVRTGDLEYDSEEIEIIRGAEKDAVLVNMGIEFNDAMEKLYMTVACK